MFLQQLLNTPDSRYKHCSILETELPHYYTNMINKNLLKIIWSLVHIQFSPNYLKNIILK